MKLKVSHVIDATLVLTAIINEKRPLPQRGKYLIARLHTKLLPEYTLAQARRDEMIKAYDMPVMRSETDAETGEVSLIGTGEFKVPDDKMLEFGAAWAAFAGEEIEVDCQPIPTSALTVSDNIDGSVQATELITLGELVQE